MSERPEIDSRVLRDIREVGWHVVKVLEDAEGPPHAFSIGLHERFDHPEIVVVGPDLEFLHQLVNAVGEQVREGRRFEGGSEASGILVGRDCAFRDVAKAWYPVFLGYAGWYYRGAGFPALQCVWPDPEGLFPWQPGFHPELARLQPVLDAPPSLRR